MAIELKTRFAPTPSGYLHIGNACNFVLNWLITRKVGGKILLRIDDLDTNRLRPEYLEDIFRSIDWLGLDYDEGPSGPDDHLQNWSQQKRIPLYQKACAELGSYGHLFACTCSRKEIRAIRDDGLYPGTCRKRSVSHQAGKTALRIKTNDHFVEWQDKLLGAQSHNIQELMPDFIVQRKDGNYAYQLSSLIDDLHFGVNGLIRGEDLLPSTAAQIFLSQMLFQGGFQQNMFLHHKLIRNIQGEKLSKSEGATSLRQLRQSAHGIEFVLKNLQSIYPVFAPAPLRMDAFLELCPIFFPF